MNKKVVKIIKILIILLVVISLLVSLVVSQNDFHIKTCHEEHCTYCAIIHIAQTIINISVVFVIAIIIGVLIYFFLSRLHKEKVTFVQSSLVFQKVQKNE